MNSPLRRRFVYHLIRILALVVLGTAGFMFIEHWRLLESLYMTVITLTTVGFGEVHPLSDAGRIYVIILILAGVSVFLYILQDLAVMFMEANPTALFGRRLMKQKIANLSNHQIVCGYGRTGQEVARNFQHNRIPLVIIEADPAHARQAENNGFLVLQGDASTDDLLLEAGIERAAGVVCTLPDDTQNTFIALSAKGLNEDIAIVCRAANPGSESKMKRAGAHMVISPYVICGRRMATAITHPLVARFFEDVMFDPAYDLHLGEIVLSGDSSIIGHTLKQANLKQTAGVMVLAVKQGGKLITNPPPELVFQGGDELIALGSEEQMTRLRELARALKIVEE